MITTAATAARFQVHAHRGPGAYVIDTRTGRTWTGMVWAGARQLADHLNSTHEPAPATYAVRGATRKTTGHYRRPGTRDLYCGRPAGAPNDHARQAMGWKMCARCVKAEALDRADATATAEAWLDQSPASPLVSAALALGDLVEAVDARRAADREAAGTWRAEWIGTRATSPEPTLFDVEPDTEQGALFA